MLLPTKHTFSRVSPFRERVRLESIRGWIFSPFNERVNAQSVPQVPIYHRRPSGMGQSFPGIDWETIYESL